MSNLESKTYTTLSPHHSFPISIATALKSSDMAIFLHHIDYWVDYNMRLNRNFHEGRYWSYQTLEELQNHFPYWTIKQLRLIIEKLTNMGILIKGNFNESRYDKTTWYSIDYEILTGMCPNGQIDKSSRTNQVAQKGTPIPDNKPYNNKNILREEHGKYVKFTKEEYQELCKKHSKEKVDEIIQDINDHCINNRPKGYTDYVAAFRGFVKNHNKTQGKNYGTKPSRGIDKGKNENPPGEYINGVRVR